MFKTKVKKKKVTSLTLYIYLFIQDVVVNDTCERAGNQSNGYH